jgi:microcystin-dependent protein
MVDLAKPNTFISELLYSFPPVTYDLVPRGTIVAFSNNYSIPNGWAECNGNNGTPDLRNRFILGRGSGRIYGEIGGEETHVLTTDEMPSHSHVIDACGNHIHNVDACGNHIHNIDVCGNHIHNIDVCGNHVHTINNAGTHTHTSNSSVDVNGYGTGLMTQDGNDTMNASINPGGEPNLYIDPVQLTINSDGDHTHTMGTEGSHIHTMQNTGSHIHTMQTSGSHIHTMQAAGSHIHIAQNTGGGIAHNNMPPYYVLIYIMRL